jgi:hypothetical protein
VKLKSNDESSVTSENVAYPLMAVGISLDAKAAFVN